MLLPDAMVTMLVRKRLGTESTWEWGGRLMGVCERRLSVHVESAPVDEVHFTTMPTIDFDF